MTKNKGKRINYNQNKLLTSFDKFIELSLDIFFLKNKKVL